MRPGLTDVAIVLGLLLLSAGLWLWWPPAAFMASGAILLVVGLYGAFRGR